jgi:hypothetical protein
MSTHLLSSLVDGISATEIYCVGFDSGTQGLHLLRCLFISSFIDVPQYQSAPKFGKLLGQQPPYTTSFIKEIRLRFMYIRGVTIYWNVCIII